MQPEIKQQWCAELEFQPGVSTPEPCFWRSELLLSLEPSPYAMPLHTALSDDVQASRDRSPKDVVNSDPGPVRKSGLYHRFQQLPLLNCKNSSFLGKGSLLRRLLTPVAN